MIILSGCVSESSYNCGYEITYHLPDFSLDYTREPYRYFKYENNLFIIDASDLIVSQNDYFYLDEFYYNGSDTELIFVQPEFSLMHYEKSISSSITWSEVNFSNGNIKNFKYDILQLASNTPQLIFLLSSLNRTDMDDGDAFYERFSQMNNEICHVPIYPIHPIKPRHYRQMKYRVMLHTKGLYRLQYSYGFFNKVIDKYIIVK